MSEQGKLRKFLKRAFFALILMPLALVPLLYGHWLWLIFLETIILISVYELLTMYRKKYNHLPLFFWLVYPLAFLSILSSYFYPWIFDNLPMYFFVFSLTVFYIIEMFFIDQANRYFQKTFFLRVVAYCCFFLPYVMLLRESGLFKMLLLLMVVWLYDSFAYVFGVAFGKHKLMKTISPKKSVEGLIGGLLATVIIVRIYLLIFKKLFFLSIGDFFILTIISVFLAQAGDLVESFIKRMLSAKDSGNLIPGHGGVLDRLDSFFLIAPAFYFLLEKVF